MKRFIFSLSLCAIASVLLTINWINDPTVYNTAYRTTAILAFVALGGVWAYTKIGTSCLSGMGLIVLAVATNHFICMKNNGPMPEDLIIPGTIISTALVVAGVIWILILLFRK